MEHGQCAMIRVAFILILLLSVGWGALVFAADTFRFALGCDSRGDTSSLTCADPATSLSPVLEVVFQDIARRSAEDKIDLLVFPGDLITGYVKRDAPTVSECNRRSLQLWRGKAEPLLKAGIEVRVTAGNHDVAALQPENVGVRCGHNYPYTPDPANFVVFQEILHDMLAGNPGPAVDLGLTYSFDMGPCHFAMLNVYTMLRDNAVTDEAIAWLEKDLAAAEAQGKLLFVAAHAPAFPGSKHVWDSLPFFDPTYDCAGYDRRFGIDRRTERDRLWNILKKHKVIAYLCGHDHVTQIQEVEGVWHCVAGGLTRKLYPLNGAPGDTTPNSILYDGAYQNPRASFNWPWDTDKKSYWGWLLFKIEGRKVTMDVIGSDAQPTNPQDLHVVKSFVLLDSPAQ